MNWQNNIIVLSYKPMDTYRFLLRLTQAEKEKLSKIKQQIEQQTGIKISANQTIKYLINDKELENDKTNR